MARSMLGVVGKARCNHVLALYVFALLMIHPLAMSLDLSKMKRRRIPQKHDFRSESSRRDFSRDTNMIVTAHSQLYPALRETRPKNMRDQFVPYDKVKGETIFAGFLKVLSARKQRTRRNVGLDQSHSICLQAKRDMSALRIILLRNSNPLDMLGSLTMRENILDRTKHGSIARTQPQLAVDSMATFLEEVNHLIKEHTRRDRHLFSSRRVRPLVLKLRSLKGKLFSLLELQIPPYTRNSAHYANLHTSGNVQSISIHLVALMSNLRPALNEICST
ncbi:uncharacterized protein LOC100184274 [Ciona intestinalis]